MLAELDRIIVDTMDISSHTIAPTPLPLQVSELPIKSIRDVCDYHGHKISLDDQVEETIARVEQKYGAWYQSIDGKENPEGNGLWRKEMALNLKHALSRNPVTLIANGWAKECGLIAYVVSANNIVAVKENGQICTKDYISDLYRKNNHPLPINDPESVFFWSRKSGDENIWIDPVFDAYAETAGMRDVFSEMLKEQHWKTGCIRDICSFSSKSHKPKIKAYQTVNQCLSHCSSDEYGLSKITRAQYALGTIVHKITRSARYAVNAAIRRFLCKPILNFARRFCDIDVYPWLIAMDAGKNQALVSARRMQFARAYPEIVPILVQNSLGFQLNNQAHMPYRNSSVDRKVKIKNDKTLYIRLHDCIDDAKPITSLIRQIRDWPLWVERCLRGKFIPSNAGGLYNGLEYDFAELLQKLGPQWALRGGDNRIAAIILILCLNFDVNVKKLCNQTVLQGNSSPWKQLYKRLPQEFKTNIRNAGNNNSLLANVVHRFTSQINDFVLAFERDIVTPIVSDPTDNSRIYFGGPSDHVLSSNSLFKLIDQSEQWHQRIQTIRIAKEAGKKITVRSELMNAWEPLFYPFTWIDGRIEVKPLLDKNALEDNGEEMNHCVGSYSYSCLSGSCHIVGFYQENKPIATAELRGYSGAQIQMQAPGNKKVNKLEQQVLDWISRELAIANPKHLTANHDDWDCEFNGTPSVLEADGIESHPGKTAVLWTLPVDYLKNTARARNEFLDENRRLSHQEYDWSDPEAVERVLVAWRFAMPERMRAVWEKGGDASERVANVEGWLLNWKNSHPA